MFTADLDDRQWLQCMCTQIPNAFTINKVGMNAGVVVNGGASCDVDGRIMSTLSTYCGCITLEGGTYGVCGLCVAANGVRAEVIFNNG